MKRYILTIAVMFISTLLSAQRIRLDDTVVVFKLKYETRNGVIMKYVPYITHQKPYITHYKLRWTDGQNIIHRSVIRKINARYLLLDTTRVYTSDISALVMTHFSWFVKRKTKQVIFDSTGLFNIMSNYDFKHLVQITSYSRTVEHIPNPIFANMSYDKFVADLERRKQRRIRHFAALDTCPLRYGIKTNLVRDLINEINLSIELPVTRSFCIDVGGGILYTGYNSNKLSYYEAFAQFRRLKSDNPFGFDHSYYNRKGFGLEVIPKFFIFRKKILYIGPQLGLHFYHYQNKWIFNYDEGEDEYHRDYYSLESEKSTSINLNAMVGLQTPQIKRFLLDAFVSLGCMYRGGTVSRSMGKIYSYRYGTQIENYDPPQTLKPGGFSLSGQIGVRLGFRFGKARLCK